MLLLKELSKETRSSNAFPEMNSNINFEYLYLLGTIGRGLSSQVHFDIKCTFLLVYSIPRTHYF